MTHRVIEGKPIATGRGRTTARRFALLCGAAAVPAIMAVGGLGIAEFVPATVAMSLSMLSTAVAVGVAAAAWREGARLDDLAARLAAEAGVQTSRTDAPALIAAAFAATEQRMAAMLRRGDPARRDDPETGLPNRQTVMRRGRDEITRARRNQHQLAVGLLSLDLGPEAAGATERGAQERALRLTAEIAMQGLRAYDIVGRWERDTFIAVIPEAEVENAVVAMERVRSMAQAARGLRVGEPLPTLHAGVAVLQPDDATIAEIAARAQRALERARSGVGAPVQAAPGPRQRPVHLTSV